MTYTSTVYFRNSEMALSFSLLVCYETRIAHFAYQPIKSSSVSVVCAPCRNSQA